MAQPDEQTHENRTVSMLEWHEHITTSRSNEEEEEEEEHGRAQGRRQKIFQWWGGATEKRPKNIKKDRKIAY